MGMDVANAASGCVSKSEEAAADLFMISGGPTHLIGEVCH